MNKIDIALAAIKLLKEGKILDSATKRKLIQVGVNIEQFIREFEIKTKDR